jgi:TPR repeat protein
VFVGGDATDGYVSEAQFEYGLLLELGRGVPIDLTHAARCYRLAADRNLAKTDPFSITTQTLLCSLN